MFDKQAVWIQCAAAFHTILSLASVVSFQYMTSDMDIFWSVLFILETIILFAAAEHANILNISPDRWIKMERVRNIVLISTVIVWSGPIISLTSYILYSILLSTILTFSPKYIQYGATIAASCIHSYTFILVTCVWVGAKVMSSKMFVSSLQKSIASKEIKLAYAWKATYVIIDGVLLWNVRCLHRFPYVFRWQPILLGMVSIVLACLYCHNNIKETRVSNNSIIVSKGHGMAASLNAAENCTVCRKCISSLDMEASFGDGFRL